MNAPLRKLGMVLILLTSLAKGDATVHAGQFHAGVAKVDISPKTLPAIKNGGFLQAMADRVVDPLYARAIVLNEGDETIALVIVDSCMLPTVLCDEIKRLASTKTGIPSNRMLISATHTHSAPSVMHMCLGSGKDEAYAKFVPEEIARAITLAHKSLRPAKLGWAIVDGAEFTNCRRWITRGDRMGTDPFAQKTVRAMMHPGYENPNYTSPAGPIDPWLSVLSLVSADDDRPLCVLGNLSMHYFGGSPGFSADYFGDVARTLESKIATSSKSPLPEFVGIMSQGTSGDLHWMDYSKPRQSISRQGYSDRLVERIMQTLSRIDYRTDVSLAMAEQRLRIKRRMPSQGRREWARPINAARLDRSPRNRVEVYAQQAEWIHENPVAEVVLQALRIGDLAITAIPNEVYGITGLKLKRQSPLAATFNLELSGGATGYIPPPEQHRLGGYTTWPARTAGLDEQAEPRIVEALLRLLETVAEKKRRSYAPAETDYSEAIMANEPFAYYRLDDMDATRARDAMGRRHATYQGAVALFLPESTRAARPQASFDDPKAYGNRCAYLAGGHIEAGFAELGNRYTTMLNFLNALPTEVRDTTGVLFSNQSLELSISGRAEGVKLKHEFEMMIRAENRADADRLSQDRIYCRTVVFGKYQSGRWLPPQTNDWFEDPADGRIDGKVEVADEPGAPYEIVPHTVFVPVSAEIILPAIQGVVSFELPRVIMIGQSMFGHPSRLDSALSYRAHSAMRRLNELPPGRQRAGTPDSNVYLQVPTDRTGARIRGLAASLSASGTSLPVVIDRIRRHFNENTAYSTTIENPQSLPPLENFLFSERRGYCEFYATAGALLLRASGIPARTAYGFCGGEQTADPLAFAFFSDDAHAWTEVYIEGSGWCIVDFTPDGYGAATPPTEAGPLSPRVERDTFPSLKEIDIEASKNWDSTQFSGGAGWKGFRIIATLTSILLIGGILAVVFRREPESVKGSGLRQLAPTMASKEPGFYRTFCDAAAKIGVPKLPGQTPKEHFAALCKTSPEANQLGELVEYYYAVRYEAAPKDRERERAFRGAAGKLSTL